MEKGKKNLLLKMDKKIIITTLIITSIGIVIGFALLYSQYQQKYEYVFLVNEEPIYRVEFDRMLIEERGNTFDYFAKKYGDVIGKDFWEKSYNGENPLAYIKEKVQDKLIKVKIKQLFAKERNLTQDISYLTFLKDWKKENFHRANADKKGEVIYGPIYLGEKQYFEKVLGELEQKVKDSMLEQQSFSEEELEECYQDNKERTFKNFGSTEVKYIKLTKDQSSIIEGRNILTEFIKEVEDGGDFELTAKKHIENSKNPNLKFLNEKMEKTTVNMNNSTFPNVLVKVQSMSPGQVSDIIEERTAFYVVKCESKEKISYLPFSGEKNKIKKMLVDERYKKQLDEFSKLVKVEVNDKTYKKIKID